VSEHLTARQVPSYCRGTCSDERSKTITKHISTCKTCSGKVQVYEDKNSPSVHCGKVEICLGRRTPLCYECKGASEFVLDRCQIEMPEPKQLPGRPVRQQGLPQMPFGLPPGMPIFHIGSPEQMPPDLARIFESMFSGLSPAANSEQELGEFAQGLFEQMEPCEDCDPTSPECQQCLLNPEGGTPKLLEGKKPRKRKTSRKKPVKPKD
jgi:hypothetical protein